MSFTASGQFVPAYDHVVVVVEENHGFNQIVGNAQASYINSLATGGALLTNYFAVTHPSQPNYFALYAGTTFGVTDDAVHLQGSQPTLGTILTSAGASFRGFVESPVVQKHAPWESITETNIPQTEFSFSSFPQTAGGFTALPTVSYVIPNQLDDMHDGTIQQGDQWLQTFVGSYATWAQTNNSLLVVVFDEDENIEGNHIATVLYGANVRTGSYSAIYNHFDLLSTLAGVRSLAGPANAATAAALDGDIFATPGAVINGDGNANALAGGTGDDSINGLASDDTLVGGVGRDTLDGGAGDDTASYIGAHGAVQVTLVDAATLGGATGGFATGFDGKDTLISIENIAGSAFGDTLTGNSGANILTGGDELTLTANQKIIYRLYGATLNREPDLPGFSLWTAQLNSGTPLATIASGFVGSVEFQNIYGALNDAAFVALLYRNVLHRAPDAAGQSSWVNQLSGGASRPSVVVGFSESVEFQGSTELASRGFATANLNGAVYGQILRLYGATLGRSPDIPGFAGWVDAIASGAKTLSNVAEGFIGSAEFAAIYGANPTDANFVTLLYNNVLRRAPDAAGQAFWLKQLSSGATRASVVLGFSDSDEYRGATDVQVRNFMLATMTPWMDRLTGGAGNDSMIGGRGSDLFNFNLAAPGADHVFGFESFDRLLFSNFGYASAADAVSRMTQQGADVVFADRAETITFHNTSLVTATAAEFSFA